MDELEMFRALRDTSSAVVEAMENHDDPATIKALSDFMVLMIKFDALKQA